MGPDQDHILYFDNDPSRFSTNTNKWKYTLIFNNFKIVSIVLFLLCLILPHLLAVFVGTEWL